MSLPDYLRLNIEKLIGRIMRDIRMQRPTYVEVQLSDEAYTAAVSFLKKENAYHPDEKGNLKFMDIPFNKTAKLPPCTFVAVRPSEKMRLVKWGKN